MSRPAMGRALLALRAFLVVLVMGLARALGGVPVIAPPQLRNLPAQVEKR